MQVDFPAQSSLQTKAGLANSQIATLGGRITQLSYSWILDSWKLGEIVSVDAMFDDAMFWDNLLCSIGK